MPALAILKSYASNLVKRIHSEDASIISCNLIHRSKAVGLASTKTAIGCTNDYLLQVLQSEDDSDNSYNNTDTVRIPLKIEKDREKFSEPHEIDSTRYKS